MIATINSTRDLDVYLQNNHPDLCVDQRMAVISLVQAADHPHYGADWGAWLRAQLVFIIPEAIEEHAGAASTLYRGWRLERY